MWLWISRRFRLWLLFAVGAPVAARVLGVVARVLEQRRGETSLTRSLQRARGWADEQTRGPVARRRRRREDRHGTRMRNR